jgi:hypothetical protein
MALILLQRFERESSCHVATRERPSNHLSSPCTRQNEHLSSPAHGEADGGVLPEPYLRRTATSSSASRYTTIPCDSSAAAALAFIAEPPGLRFVVVISQLLDAVQCGIASAARLNPYPTTVGVTMSRHNIVCPISGLNVRSSDNIRILDEKASLIVMRARRGSAHGTSASSASAAWEVTAACVCERMPHRGARDCASRRARPPSLRDR